MRLGWMALAGLLAAAPAAGQTGLALEVRGGASAGNYAAAASDFEVAPKPAFGATLSYAVTPMIGVYAGYSRSSFGCDTGFCTDRDMTFTSAGVDAGVRLALPLGPVSPWVRAGVVSHSLGYDGTMENGETRQGDGDGSVGFEAGGGVQINLGRRLAVTPGVRYVRYGSAGEDGVAMVVGDVGLVFRM